MTLWVGVLTAVLFALNIGRIAPIEGTFFVDTVTLCDGDSCTPDTALPYHTDRPALDETLTRVVIAMLPLSTAPDALQALYIPKLSETASVTLNGELLFSAPEHLSLWSTPLLIDVPPAMLRTGDNEVMLTLSGPAQEGLDLWPLHFGPREILAPYAETRSNFGPGVARFSMGFMAVLAVALLLIWWNRRAEMHYFWLAASCLTVLVILTHYATGPSIGTYKIWTLLWPFSAALYINMILRFLRHMLAFPIVWLEQGHFALIALCAGAGLVLPGGYTFIIAIGVNAISAPVAISVLVILWTSRSTLKGPDFPVFFACISGAVSLGVYDLTLFGLTVSPRSLQLFQWMPAVMSFACVYLVLSKFVQSLRGYERLTASLNETLEQRTAELEDSFSRLAKTEKREAIAEERTRIMLDLHDGLGGQLVNTLAYIQRTGAGDKTIQRALEDALRDLALMLDSVETQDSLVTLLGMLRTRLEGLLADHGITFDWQIGEEPSAPFKGPSPNLHLARIVQEAITNVIKHANATTITVATDETTITIADNGCGISEQACEGRADGHGIGGMRRRCERIGATFSIARTDTGTIVALTFQGDEGAVPTQQT